MCIITIVTLVLQCCVSCLLHCAVHVVIVGFSINKNWWCLKQKTTLPWAVKKGAATKQSWINSTGCMVRIRTDIKLQPRKSTGENKV